MTMTRVFVLKAALAALIAGATALPAVAQDTASPPAQPAPVATRPPAISVVAAEVRTVAETVAVTGTLKPREEVQVSIDIEGFKIDDLLADEGDSVEAGQVLARLSTDTLDIQLAQNDSQLKRAEAAIAQAKSEIASAQATLTEVEAARDRAEALVDKQVISQDVLERRVSASAIARSRLATAEQGVATAEADKTLIEAQRREIELRKSKTEIRAPTDGLVLERAARIGAVASAASGPLFRIARDGLVELDAEVIETELSRVVPGQTVIVTPAGGEPVTGTVRLLSPEVNPATRLGHVRVAFPPGTPLRFGSFSRGEIEVARREGVTVPVAAVVTSEDSATVQVVKDDIIETRVVKTGLSSGGVIEIVEGLAAGDIVVARAGTFLRDGDRITPVDARTREIKG
jgi:HlyD family secretion protein